MAKERFNSFENEWRKIVSKWGRLNSECLQEIDELPATFVENSNSALFSVAAWQSGYKCLCEVRIERSIKTGGRPIRGNGRFDLQLHFENSLVVIEAKHRNFVLGSPKYSLRHRWTRYSIERVAEAAKKCSKGARDWEADLGGLVFFSAVIPPGAPCRNESRVWEVKRKACKELIDLEIDKLRPCLEKAPSGFTFLGSALYENSIDTLNKDGADFDWPALFGVIGILKNKRS